MLIFVYGIGHFRAAEYPLWLKKNVKSFLFWAYSTKFWQRSDNIEVLIVNKLFYNRYCKNYLHLMNFFTHCFLKLKITKWSITYSYSNIIACYITFVLENGFLTMSLLYCNRSRVMKIARYIAINVANSYDM